MFAAPPPHPLEGPVLVTVLVSALLLLVGAILAPCWRGSAAAAWIRGLALLTALGVTLELEEAAQALCVRSEDFGEGVRAMSERREPRCPHAGGEVASVHQPGASGSHDGDGERLGHASLATAARRRHWSSATTATMIEPLTTRCQKSATPRMLRPLSCACSRNCSSSPRK